MTKPTTSRILLSLLAVFLSGALLAGCGRGKKQASAPDPGASAEPDRVLFERATEDIRRGRHTIGRLTLQTLINTYPDSEFIPKAKLAIADSFYNEGGTAGLTQAVAEYKDFCTFFPFLPECAYAQFRVGMSHFRRMEKPDRDRTQARMAEEEFQTFILKFGDHEMAPQAEQRLREIQEVLAEGDFRIALYYYRKGSFRASGGRLLEMVDRYPLYSQADRSLWMLGDIFERVEKTEIAARFYARIVKDYPLSPMLEDAKSRLIALGFPIPQPDAAALARMQKEREALREKPGLLRRSLGLFATGPDVSGAARGGKPNLTPPVDVASSQDTLTPGTNLNVIGGTTGGNAGGGSPVATVPAGSAAIVIPPPAAPAAESSSKPSTDAAKKAEAERKKKEEEEKKGKKKGLRRIIPW